MTPVSTVITPVKPLYFRQFLGVMTTPCTTLVGAHFVPTYIDTPGGVEWVFLPFLRGHVEVPALCIKNKYMNKGDSWDVNQIFQNNFQVLRRYKT